MTKEIINRELADSAKVFEKTEGSKDRIILRRKPNDNGIAQQKKFLLHVLKLSNHKHESKHKSISLNGLWEYFAVICNFIQHVYQIS
ncbi:hypothetical protein AYI69_g2314 [Smittium culicis]|uniref:Uncharacterized protein n=1 Tax=Smittium culicis TaxID=133412 RepID=A0A1R1YNA6_9FUNG|nr:hypothetical protein AYI69_g2314 [Smittium culicis]